MARPEEGGGSTPLTPPGPPPGGVPEAWCVTRPQIVRPHRVAITQHSSEVHRPELSLKTPTLPPAFPSPTLRVDTWPVRGWARQSSVRFPSHEIPIHAVTGEPVSIDTFTSMASPMGLRFRDLVLWHDIRVILGGSTNYLEV